MPETFLVEARRLLRQYGIRPSKRLGQSFLVDPGVLELILKEACLGPEEVIVEIGPGLGALTRGLARKAAFVLAVEIDERLCRILREAFREEGRVSVIHADALKCDFETYLRGRTRGKVKVVANIPYSITTPLLTRLISLPHLFSSLLVMVQREVAARMLAMPGGKDYGSFSVYIQYYTDVHLLAEVPREAFYPRPGVDSSLVRLDIRASPRIKVRDEVLFFELVRAAFGQRRKTLRNALLAHPVLIQDPRKLDQALAVAGILPKRRGETLDLEDFGRLYGSLFGLHG